MGVLLFVVIFEGCYLLEIQGILIFILLRRCFLIKSIKKAPQLAELSLIFKWKLQRCNIDYKAVTYIAFQHTFISFCNVVNVNKFNV